MKPNPSVKFIAAALVGASASCSSPPTPVERVQVSAPIRSDSSLSGKLFAEVNSYRAARGKASLQRHPGLDRLAQKHCDYLVKTAGQYSLYGKNVSHIGFEGRALSARQSFNINSVGENVVSSTNHSPGHLVHLWTKSKTHEHNMITGWSCSGIGTAVAADGSVIVTQIFGDAPKSSAVALRERFNRH